MSYRERYEDVFKLALEVSGCDVVDGQLATDENVFHHQIATGAMVAEVLDKHGFDPLIQRLGAYSAAVHDAGKYHPEIRSLMLCTEGRAFTAQEREVMQSHTVRGYESIIELRRGYRAETEAAAFVALHHHDVFTERTYQVYKGLAGLAHVVQLCDISHARLFDKSRTYSKARDGGVLSAERIGAQIIEQFAPFPPTIEQTTIRVEQVVSAWVKEVLGQSNDTGTLDT